MPRRVVRAGVARAILHAAMEIDFARLARAHRAVDVDRAVLHAGVPDLTIEDDRDRGCGSMGRGRDIPPSDSMKPRAPRSKP